MARPGSTPALNVHQDMSTMQRVEEPLTILNVSPVLSLIVTLPTTLSALTAVEGTISTQMATVTKSLPLTVKVEPISTHTKSTIQLPIDKDSIMIIWEWVVTHAKVPMSLYN